MREITICRVKSFVGCLGKMKVYIEDPFAGDVTINGLLCRKLGVLKNGQQATFQVDDRAAKIFVIADQLSKGYCSEYYQLPEGEDNITLTGKNHFNPAAGNPFRFDNNQSEGIQAHRKKGMKKGLVVLLVAMIVGLIVGGVVGYNLVGQNSQQEKVFTAEDMSITLNGSFRKTEYEGYTVVFDSQNVAVFALKEPFTLAEGLESYSVQDYRALLIQANGISYYQSKQQDGLYWFEYNYTDPNSGDIYHYYTYSYKASDAFWMIQFALLDAKTAEYEDLIHQWAGSVQFGK